jgi:hypothetical protein
MVTSPSHDPVTIRDPSGMKETQDIGDEDSGMVVTRSPDGISRTLTPRGIMDETASRLLSGAKLKLSIPSNGRSKLVPCDGVRESAEYNCRDSPLVRINATAATQRPSGLSVAQDISRETSVLARILSLMISNSARFPGDRISALSQEIANTRPRFPLEVTPNCSRNSNLLKSEL